MVILTAGDASGAKNYTTGQLPRAFGGLEASMGPRSLDRGNVVSSKK